MLFEFGSCGIGHHGLLTNGPESKGHGECVSYPLRKFKSAFAQNFKQFTFASDVLQLRDKVNTVPYWELSREDRIAGIRALTTLESLYGLPDNASELQRKVASALEEKGFTVETEATANGGEPRQRRGRLDILAQYKGGRVAIELDARSPRRKSLEKLRRFKAFRIIGLRGVSLETPFGIDAVAMLHIGTDPTPDFELLLHHYPGRPSSRTRKAAFAGFVARLRQGCDPAAIVTGMKRYGSWYAAEGASQPEPGPIPLVTWLERDMWEYRWDSADEDDFAECTSVPVLGGAA